MLDLIKQWFDILGSPVAPLWLKGGTLLILIAFATTASLAALGMIMMFRYSRSRRAFARRHGWRWRGGEVYGGLIADGAPWEGGCHTSDDEGRYMNWSAGPLPVDNALGLMIISRGEYERVQKRVRETLQRRAGVTAFSYENAVASVGLGTALLDSGIVLDINLARPECRANSWARDPKMREWSVGGATFQQRYAVLSNSAALAERVTSARLVDMMLALPVTERGRFKAHLRSNRLTVEATPGRADAASVEGFLEMAILIAAHVTQAHR